MSEAEHALLMLMAPAQRLEFVRLRIVGSGFARADTICLGCEREITYGMEAWVTSWTDNNAIALHPDCWPGNVAVGVAYTEWLDKITEMGQ